MFKVSFRPCKGRLKRLRWRAFHFQPTCDRRFSFVAIREATCGASIPSTREKYRFTEGVVFQVFQRACDVCRPLRIHVDSDRQVFMAASLLRAVLCHKVLFRGQVGDFLNVVGGGRVLSGKGFFPDPFTTVGARLLFRKDRRLRVLIRRLLMYKRLNVNPFGITRRMPTYLFFAFQDDRVLSLKRFFWSYGVMGCAACRTIAGVLFGD